jgi:hypothetical protein
MKDLLKNVLMGLGIAVVGILAVPMVILIVICKELGPKENKNENEK